MEVGIDVDAPCSGHTCEWCAYFVSCECGCGYGYCSLGEVEPDERMTREDWTCENWEPEAWSNEPERTEGEEEMDKTPSIEVIRWVRDHGGIKELEKRLMPKGIEWPRYDTSELVLIGDDVTGPDYCERIHVDEITFHANGFTVREKTGLDHWYENDDRFKRPAVLAADGAPLEVGQTVWDVNNCMEFTVSRLPEPGEYQAVEVRYRNGSSTSFDPCQLTHTKPEPPDSWERLEDDCSKFCIEYCDEHGLLDTECNAAEGDASTRHCADCGDSCEERMARDLVRRAKALAERGK